MCMAEKSNLNKEVTEQMAQRLVAARVAAGYQKRSQVFERFPSWNQDTYSSHELGRRKISEPFARKYAEAFKVSVSHLLGHDLVEEIEVTKPTPNASFPPRWQRFSAAESIPLLGQTAGGANGRFILNGSEVGRVFTPPMLEGVEDAYAVRVYGTSMEPRYYAGETVWLNPHEPVRQGDDVVVQLLTDEENGRESYIKRFVSKSSKVTRLWQHNPDETETNELEFDSERVFSVHKIVFHATV